MAHKGEKSAAYRCPQECFSEHPSHQYFSLQFNIQFICLHHSTVIKITFFRVGNFNLSSLRRGVMLLKGEGEYTE